MARDDSTTSTIDWLALLPLPALIDLTEQQVRGIACIWDGVHLHPAIAVDLGVREASRAGAPVAWYPRACRACVHDIALRELHIHAPACALCKSETALDDCATGTTLRRLMREYRR